MCFKRSNASLIAMSSSLVIVAIVVASTTGVAKIVSMHMSHKYRLVIYHHVHDQKHLLWDFLRCQRESIVSGSITRPDIVLDIFLRVC